MVACKYDPVLKVTASLAGIAVGFICGACVPCVVAAWPDLQAYGCCPLPGHTLPGVFHYCQSQVSCTACQHWCATTCMQHVFASAA